jgi:predicted SAM-dependent methyltransferase
LPEIRTLARNLARSAAWPIWQRIWVRVERRIASVEARISPQEAQLGTLEARLGALEAQLVPQEGRLAALEGGWRQQVPAFLNAVGTVDAFAHQLVRQRQQTGATLETIARQLEEVAVQSGQAAQRLEEMAAQRLEALAAQSQSTDALAGRLDAEIDQTRTRLDNGDASIGALWERIEFVRREVLFEMAHGSGRTGQDAAPQVASRILAQEKVDAARAAGALRLNLGCGHIALPDHVNVDMRELPGVDVLAEVGALPFEPESVDAIASAHLLEHFPQEMLRRRLLPHWFGLLRPGGRFNAVTPDAAAMLAAAGAGTYPFEDFREVVFGAQDYAGDYHYNLFTPDSLRALLEEAGFRDVAVPVAGRRNGKCFEFEISARRP